MKFLLITFLITFCFLCTGCAQVPYKSSVDSAGRVFSLYSRMEGTKPSMENTADEKSRSGDTYNFVWLRGMLGAFNSLIEYSNGNNFYIDEQKKIIDNIVSSAQYSYLIPDNRSPFKDSFKGWISLNPKRSYRKEVVLYEGYAFFYIAQFLYYLKNTGWTDKSEKNKIWWQNKLDFLEKNIWKKWVVRCQKYKRNKYEYFLRSRTHMGSHWAGVAMYLGRMTSDSVIKAECLEDQREYDLLLKRNLRPNPYNTNAYVWHSTYDNVEGTDAVEIKPAIVQDVSHGNHVVAYIVAAYEMGDKNWSLDDIHKLCNTLKEFLYNKTTGTFADNVNGTNGTSRPGWGNFEADGWVKLSKYDKEVNQIFSGFYNSKMLKKYNQELQFKANFLHFGGNHNQHDSSSSIK